MRKNFLKLAAIALLLAGTAVACENKEDENPALKDTMWKLVGFVNAETGKIKEAEPVDKKCYCLSFDADSTLTGISSTNKLMGNYKIDYETYGISIAINAMTEIAERYDGELFIIILNDVQLFFLQDNELRLYYNDNKSYLLFNSQKS